MLFDQRQSLDKRVVTLSVVFRFGGWGWGRGRNQYLCIDLDIVRSVTVSGREGCHFGVLFFDFLPEGRCEVVMVVKLSISALICMLFNQRVPGRGLTFECCSGFCRICDDSQQHRAKIRDVIVLLPVIVKKQQQQNKAKSPRVIPDVAGCVWSVIVVVMIAGPPFWA